MLKGRKHLSQRVMPMVSVAGKADLQVFVQLGAKINIKF